MKKALAALASVAIALSIGLMPAVAASGAQSGDGYTPGYSSTNETCVAGEYVAGSISVVVTTGIAYALTGPDGEVALNGGSSGPIPPGTYTLTASDGNADDGYVVTPLSTPIVIASYEGECGAPEPEVVTPTVVVMPQTCVAGELEGGRITVNLNVPGVTYLIDGGSIAFDAAGTTAPLAPGSYTVTATDADPSDGYVLDAPFAEEFVVNAHDGSCYTSQPSQVTPKESSVDEKCYADDILPGHITVDLTVPGVTYLINGGAVAFDGTTGSTGPLAPGTYTVTATDSDPNDSYVLYTRFEKVIEILPYDGECGSQPEIVTPKVDSLDQICEAGELVGGWIIVDLTVLGVTYLIDGGAVTFDANGVAGPLAPGEYVVTATDSDPNDGYLLEDPFETIITILASDDLDCVELPDHPLVTPFASSLAGSCTVNGSYSLGNSEVAGAVTWTANGQPIGEGSHVVNGAATIHLVATANGPDYGFGEGTQTEWTFEFTAPTACGDLETLALTGAEESGTIGSLGLLTLVVGTLLISAARLRRGRVTA